MSWRLQCKECAHSVPQRCPKPYMVDDILLVCRFRVIYVRGVLIGQPPVDLRRKRLAYDLKKTYTALLSKFLIQLFSTTLICVMVFPGLLGGSITIRIHICIMVFPGLLGVISKCLIVTHAGLPERCCKRCHVKDYVFLCGVLPVE